MYPNYSVDINCKEIITMYKNKVWRSNKYTLTVFTSGLIRKNHTLFGICLESGKGMAYKSFWLNLGYFTCQFKSLPRFLHIQGLIFAISTSY
jgi:hypothetical protein